MKPAPSILQDATDLVDRAAVLSTEKLSFPFRQRPSPWRWLGLTLWTAYAFKMIAEGISSPDWLTILLAVAAVLSLPFVIRDICKPKPREFHLGIHRAGFDREPRFRYGDAFKLIERTSHIDVYADGDFTPRMLRLERHTFSLDDWNRLVPLLKQRILAANPSVELDSPETQPW